VSNSPQDLNEWIAKKVAQAQSNVWAILEYMNSGEDVLYNIDEHVFEIDDVIPFSNEQILSVSLAAGFSQFWTIQESLKLNGWSKYFFDDPIFVVPEEWVHAKHNNTGFFYATPPYTSNIIWRKEDDYLDAMEREKFDKRVHRAVSASELSWVNSNYLDGLDIFFVTPDPELTSDEEYSGGFVFKHPNSAPRPG